MKIATQDEVDKFFQWAINDPEIYPYLTVNKRIFRREIPKDDWEGFMFISDCGKCFMHISLNRTKDIEFDISMWSKSPLLAGRCVKIIEELIRRYKPTCLDSCVHSSNERAIKWNRRVLGQEWGIEPKGAWNMLNGEYEDLYHFKRLL